MAFIDERYPVAYSYNPIGGPEFSVILTQSEGGVESRIPQWGGLDYDYSLSKFDLDARDFTGEWGAMCGLWAKSPRLDYQHYLDFWRCVAQGQANGFRFQHMFDNYAYRQYLINTNTNGFEGDGTTTTFQLARQYASQTGATGVSTKVYKPLGTHATSVTEYLNVNRNGIPVIQQVTTAPLLYANLSTPTALSTSVYEIDNLGKVTFDTAPLAGIKPTATFYFDYPVRFDNTVFPGSFNSGKFLLDSVTLVELREAI